MSQIFHVPSFDTVAILMKTTKKVRTQGETDKKLQCIMQVLVKYIKKIFTGGFGQLTLRVKPFIMDRNSNLAQGGGVLFI